MAQSSYCENTLPNAVLRQFMHGNIAHFTSNMYVMIDISSKILQRMTTLKFIVLILLIFVLCVLMDYLFYYECSIGLSGVVFGLLTWFLLSYNGISQKVLIDLGILLLPSVLDRRISFGGHFMGIISGFITYIIIKP